MRIITHLIKAVSLVAAVLAGIWTGGQIRASQTGRPVNALISEFEIGDRRYRNFPPITRFYPALLLALKSRPRPLWGFLWGLLAGWLLDDRFERVLLPRLFANLDS